jgi:hypothetical protein
VSEHPETDASEPSDPPAVVGRGAETYSRNAQNSRTFAWAGIAIALLTFIATVLAVVAAVAHWG